MTASNIDKADPDNSLTQSMPRRARAEVLVFKRRILEWPNPVEYVNNLYGCHPDNGRDDYFKEVFAR